VSGPVLVAYASKHGSTAEIADSIGETLRRAGLEVEVRPAREVRAVTGYRAVIVGSSIYAGRWQGPALDLLRKNAAALVDLPVWLFSSGPLDETAETEPAEPSKAVRQLIERLGVRDHATFGGKLAPDASGFIERLMIRNGRIGDWRDFDHIRAWARDIGSTLTAVDVF
jgi:menaquinone-dependent protoporphyrinogen oxidase